MDRNDTTMSDGRKAADHWHRVTTILPDIGRVVETKIDDESGARNETKLKRGGNNGRMWFTPDGSMYVYYTPTHWRPAS